MTVTATASQLRALDARPTCKLVPSISCYARQAGKAAASTGRNARLWSVAWSFLLAIMLTLSEIPLKHIVSLDNIVVPMDA